MCRTKTKTTTLRCLDRALLKSGNPAGRQPLLEVRSLTVTSQAAKLRCLVWEVLLSLIANRKRGLQAAAAALGIHAAAPSKIWASSRKAEARHVHLLSCLHNIVPHAPAPFASCLRSRHIRAEIPCNSRWDAATASNCQT